MFTDIANLFAGLGFPVGVAVYLLVYQSRKMDKITSALMEVRIGLRVILTKLEATDEYLDAVNEFRSKKQENGA